MNRMSYLLQREKNSFDFVRFTAALMVILSHSFNRDPLATLSDGRYFLGGSAVMIFFITSGFLIIASMDRSQDWVAYAKARFLRIYPALFVVVLLTIFVLGPLMTSLTVADYFKQPETYGYFRVLLLYKTDYLLPGVFTTNYHFAGLVNGPLWTLFYEVLFYMMIAVLWAVRLLRKQVVLALFVLLVISRSVMVDIYPALGIHNGLLDMFHNFYSSYNIAQGTELLMYFMAGMVFYLYRDRISLRRRYFLLSIPFLLIALALQMQLFKPWCALWGAYDLFYLASSQRSPFKRFGAHGDFSYGMYIYAFPIQQSLVHFFGTSLLTGIEFIVATGITLLFAMVSWNLIEKPALKLKNAKISFFGKPAVVEVRDT